MQDRLRHCDVSDREIPMTSRAIRQRRSPRDASRLLGGSPAEMLGRDSICSLAPADGFEDPRDRAPEGKNGRPHAPQRSSLLIRAGPVYIPLSGITQGENMAHVVSEKRKLINRVRRLRGQIDALERTLEADASCADVMQVLTAARGAINALMAEVVEDHIRDHMIDPARSPTPRESEAADELVTVLHSYIK